VDSVWSGQYLTLGQHLEDAWLCGLCRSTAPLPVVLIMPMNGFSLGV